MVGVADVSNDPALLSIISGSGASSSARVNGSSSHTPDEHDARPSIDPEDKKARDAANKFESLLIHSMLKSMRKTTMSENTSNEQGMYYDMLDEKLADTMIKAGGLGVADQIYDQIRHKSSRDPERNIAQSDTARLRQLVQSMDLPTTNTVDAEKNGTSKKKANADISSLRMATALWVSEKNHKSNATTNQHDFIAPLLPHAKNSAARLGTSARAVLAIAALETGWGKHMIKDENGVASNNLFGIKATSADNSFATTLTTEYINGETHKLKAKFKKYDSIADSVSGFADFVLNNPRYSKALQHAEDPERFLYELQEAGYATDPDYATKAISIMRQIPKYLTSL